MEIDDDLEWAQERIDGVCASCHTALRTHGRQAHVAKCVRQLTHTGGAQYRIKSVYGYDKEAGTCMIDYLDAAGPYLCSPSDFRHIKDTLKIRAGATMLRFRWALDIA